MLKTSLSSRKKRRQLERKLIKAKRNAWHHGQKIPMSIETLSPELEENVEKKKKRKRKKKSTEDDSSELTIDEKAAQEHHRRILLEDNAAEDAQIKRLEKLLGIKSERKNYLKGFVDDGLDFLLDFCDKDKRKEIINAEGEGSGNAWEDDNEDEDQQWLKKKQRERVHQANEVEKERPASIVEKRNNKRVKFTDETETVKEDIYGRPIGEGSNSLYVPPALRRASALASDSSLVELKRRLQGQLNRLSEKNLGSILSEIESLYRTSSRASMNTCLSQLFDDTLLSSKALSNDSLLSEHALVACLLHANIGLEVGSFFLEALLVQFTEHLRDDVETKILDNLLIFISYLYAFHMTNSKLIFDLGRELLNVDELNEKRLEVILLLLKTIGFLLRKDNPLELKVFLQQVRTASASLSPSSKRVQFMMETITSLKNNDIRKLPGAYEPERIDRLRKVYKSLVKDKNVQQANLLNVSLEDFRLAKERGRWWIVGSAWQKPIEPKKSTSTLLEEQVDDKIRLLAKQQHMNTDIRRSIFATLLTSQDCDEAVEKLHKLNLSKIQEREIIHVTVHCALHEKTYNPYYTLILQRFAEYDRRFQISLQYHTWDRFKDLSLLTDGQLANFGSTLSQLLLSNSISLMIFKNFNFIELTPSARTFLVQLFVQLFEKSDERSLQSLFQFSAKKNVKFLREALRLFLSHFILKKKQFSELIHRRCQLALAQLTEE